MKMREKTWLRGMTTGVALAVVLTSLMWGSALQAQVLATTKQLTSQIDYTFVLPPQPQDDEGRNLFWEATVQGDINGTMLWWFEAPPPASLLDGSVAYYAARWEIWDELGEELLLAGQSAGKTVFPAAFPAEAAMWDGHGVVTEARGKFSPLKGRRTYETGPVIFDGRLSGTGIFVIN